MSVAVAAGRCPAMRVANSATAACAASISPARAWRWISSPGSRSGGAPTGRSIVTASSYRFVSEFPQGLVPAGHHTSSVLVPSSTTMSSSLPIPTPPTTGALDPARDRAVGGRSDELRDRVGRAQRLPVSEVDAAGLEPVPRPRAHVVRDLGRLGIQRERRLSGETGACLLCHRLLVHEDVPVAAFEEPLRDDLGEDVPGVGEAP